MSVSKLHYINVGPKGTFHHSGDVQTVPEDIDAIIQNLEDEDITKVALHFHGGLNNEATGMKVAEKMLPVYRDADSHQIAFVWETGLMETVMRNITTIHSTKLFKKLLKVILRHAGKKLGGITGRGASVSVSFEAIDMELAKEYPFQDFQVTTATMRGVRVPDEQELEELTPDIEMEIQEDLEMDAEEIDLLLTVEAPTTALLDQNKILAIQTEAGTRGVGTFITMAKALAIVVKNVVKRYLAKTDHGFYPTVVEEILRYYYLADFGKWVWDGMKSAAINTWLENDHANGLDQHVGTYFLDKIAALQIRKPDLVIDVVGHSAGAIIICEMFKALQKQHSELTIRNILLLAPACTADLFIQEIVNHSDRYTHVRMFTMEDHFECQDSLVKGVYTRSLLYFISGVLEDAVDKHILGMQRYLTGEKPYNRHGSTHLIVKNYMSQHQIDAGAQMVLANTEKLTPGAPAGYRSTSESHGDFDDDDKTRESLTHIIKA